MNVNRGFQTSLACLQHPMSLLCIGILLVNDHVLKIVAPSWLTGKLSDFAGLFFFPFIIAAGIGLLPGTFKLSTKQIGYLSFGVVAIWFTALKTLPVANAVTAQFAGTLLGRPTIFALDATDLIALLAMVSAWTLWNRQETANPRRIAYAALCIGAVASMATSPAAMPTFVTSFGYRAGVVYARTDGGFGVFRSSDAGATWESCYKRDCPTIPALEQTRQVPITVCDTASPELCFRIRGKPAIEASMDGGQTWSTAWEIPAGRIPYLGRGAGSAKAEEMMPQDLIIVQGSESYLLAAMGKAGILRRALPGGEWQKIEVGHSLAFVYTAPYFSYAMMDTALELGMWMLISVALLMVGGFLVWMRALAEKMSLLRLVGWMLQVLGSAVGAVVLTTWLSMFLLFVLSGTSLPGWLNSSDFVFGVAAILIYAALFLAFQWNIRSIVTKLVQGIEARRNLLLILFSMAAVNCVASVVIWPLWAMGIIWDYNTALVLASAMTIVVLAVGALLIHRETARSEGPQPNNV